MRPAETEQTKIGISGPPCSGKSTTLHEFAEQTHHPVSVAEEQANILLKDIAPQDRANLLVQIIISNAIEHEELVRHAEAPMLLCDRTKADGLGYLTLAEKPEETEAYFQHIRAWLPTYDRFVICSPDGIPYVQNDVRTEPPEFRPLLFEAMKEAFDRYEIPYVVLEGTREERAAKVHEILVETHQAG